MNNLLLVAIGGAAGAVGRYLTGVGFGRAFGIGQPYLPTLIVNVVGGLLMGLLIGWLALKASEGGLRLRLLLGVGVLGGFTTFSSFSLDAVVLFERRAFGLLSAYVGGSVLLSIGALALGLALARRLFA